VEGLEERWVLSSNAGGLSVIADSSPAMGQFSANHQQFVYTTPQGTHVLLKIIGRGSLEGTTVDSSGALHLLFSGTNAFTKIFSDVHGGTGQADLASIYNRDLFNHAANSLSGIGATLIGTINLPKFNLIDNGTVNVTSGINILALNSVGSNTQIQLRQIPPSVTAGTSTSTSNEDINNTYISNAFLVQTLAGSDGEFISAGNIVLTSTPGNPGPPPAPPGIVIKINHINGSLQTSDGKPVNLQTDAKIFGYDATTGQVLQFSLDLNQSLGTLDKSFTPISVPGSPASVGLSVGRDGNRQVLLVSTSSQIYVYDATFGTSLGSFTAPPGFVVTSMGSTDAFTVIGDTAPASSSNMFSNQMQLIDVAASLSSPTHVATSPGGSPIVYLGPPAGFALLSGLTGIPGSNRVYSATSATFNSFTPTQPVLGVVAVDTSQETPGPNGTLVLSHKFTTVTGKAVTQNGNFKPIPNPDPLLGTSVGSVDRNLAFNMSTPAVNTIALYGQVSLDRRGTIKLDYSNPLTDLSETFRPDLAGTALVDVQGDIQSFRGLTANGLVLNDTGNLNLLKTGTITNSTILAQPITHIQTSISLNSNVMLISSSTFHFISKRHPLLTVNPSLQQIGPLSQPNDSPNP
jgi:hypothetical protein